MSKSCFMYHPTHGKKLFDADKQDMKQLAADGWLDNPGKIDGTLPGYVPAAAKVETPTPVVDTAPAAVDPVVGDVQEPAADETDQPEPDDKPEPAAVDGRTTQPVVDVQELMAIFNAEPTRLTVEELVTLGQSFNLDVRRNWKEETLIAKIRQGLNSGNN